MSCFLCIIMLKIADLLFAHSRFSIHRDAEEQDLSSVCSAQSEHFQASDTWPYRCRARLEIFWSTFELIRNSHRRASIHQSGRHSDGSIHETRWNASVSSSWMVQFAVHCSRKLLNEDSQPRLSSSTAILEGLPKHQTISIKTHGSIFFRCWAGWLDLQGCSLKELSIFIFLKCGSDGVMRPVHRSCSTIHTPDTPPARLFSGI